MSSYLSGLGQSIQSGWTQTKVFFSKKAVYVVSATLTALASINTAIEIDQYCNSQINGSYLASHLLINAAVIGMAGKACYARWCDQGRFKERLEAVARVDWELDRVRQTALVCLPEADYNGAFNFLSPSISHLADDVRLIIFSSSGRDELAQRVQLVRNRYPDIRAAIVQGHGDAQTILQGDRCGFLCSDIRSQDLIQIFQFLPPGSDFIAESCGTGVRGGICEQTARGLRNVRVYGPTTSIGPNEPRIFVHPRTRRLEPVYLHNRDDVTQGYDQNGPIRYTDAELQDFGKWAEKKEDPVLAFTLAARYEKQDNYPLARKWYLLSSQWTGDVIGADRKAAEMLEKMRPRLPG